jgi:HK97 family phage major capsid protein
MPETATDKPTLLDQKRALRLRKVDAWAEFIASRETVRASFEGRTNSDEFKRLPVELRDGEVQRFKDEEAAFRAASDQRRAELVEMDTEIRDQEIIEQRRNEAAKASSGVKMSVGNEPLTYRSDNARGAYRTDGTSGQSYWRDLALVHGPGITLRTGGTRDEAEKRLRQHANEMETLAPQRNKALEQRARAQFETAEQEFLASFRDKRTARLIQETRDGISYSPFEQRVEPNTADGYGGYFIPPDWLVSEFIAGLRAHRVAAGLPRQFDMPAGTNQILIPKLATLTLVGYQQMNNSGLPSQDFTDTFVSASAKTMGGYADIALQLLEQSPGAIVDEVVTVDMMAAADKFEDAEIVAGDGLNAATLNGGHLTGIYPYTNWSGTNNVVYTDASPSAAHLISVFGAMTSNIAKTRFNLDELKFVLNGRRWFWFATSTDAYGRPYGETVAGGRQNIAAAIEGGLQPEGLVGTLPFLGDAPVYSDYNVPVTDGDGTRDVMIGGLFGDAWNFKSPVRTDVFREVLSASLGVRFRMYWYQAYLERYGQSFAIAQGSGLTTPVGAVSGLNF